MTVAWGNGAEVISTTKEYHVDTLAKYINRVGLLKAKHQLFFRGLSDQEFPLIPSLDRPIKKEDPHRKWLEVEYKLVEFSEQRFPDSFVKQTPALLIANMQHYGIPTRMMDVSGNALVALFFACENEDKNGEVLIFDEDVVSAYNPYANIIADTYRLTNNSRLSVDIYRYHIYHQSYCSALTEPGWETLSSKEDNNLDYIKKPLIVDVGAVNQRQINQNGKFILIPNLFYSDEDGKDFISNQLVKIEKNSDFVTSIIKIPSEAKRKIKEQLKLVGITRDFLFPDDTGAICDGIKQMIQAELFSPE